MTRKGLALASPSVTHGPRSCGSFPIYLCLPGGGGRGRGRMKEEKGRAGRGKDVQEEELRVGYLKQCACRKAAGSRMEVPKEGQDHPHPQSPNCPIVTGAPSGSQMLGGMIQADTEKQSDSPTPGRGPSCAQCSAPTALRPQIPPPLLLAFGAAQGPLAWLAGHWGERGWNGRRRL